MSRAPGWVRVVAAAVSVLTILNGVSGPSRPSPQSPDDVYVLDPFAASAADVRDLHSQRRAAFCHLRAGLWEPTRPDADRFDTNAIGSVIDERDTHPGAAARWLDVRRWDELGDVLADRLALCVAKGFDGVILSAVDGYAHPTGFQLTLADQAAFTRSLVALAHSRALVVAIVASPETPAALVAGADLTVPPQAVPPQPVPPQPGPPQPETLRRGDAGAAGSGGMSTTTGS